MKTVRRIWTVVLMAGLYLSGAGAADDEMSTQSSYSYTDEWSVVSAPPPAGPYRSVNIDPRVPGQGIAPPVPPVLPDEDAASQPPLYMPDAAPSAGPATAAAQPEAQPDMAVAETAAATAEPAAEGEAPAVRTESPAVMSGAPPARSYGPDSPGLFRRPGYRQPMPSWRDYAGPAAGRHPPSDRYQGYRMMPPPEGYYQRRMQRPLEEVPPPPVYDTERGYRRY